MASDFDVMQDKEPNQLKIVIEVRKPMQPQGFAHDDKFHQDRLLRISIRKAVQYNAFFGRGSTTNLLSSVGGLRATTRAPRDDESL